MRAIIPAAILLVIGLVAALPFKRPPTSLSDSSGNATTTEVRKEATLPDPAFVQSPLVIDRSAPQEPLPQMTLPPVSAGHPSAPTPVKLPAHLARSYREAMIPLAEPAPEGLMVPRTELAREDAKSNSNDNGKWKTGLAFEPRTLPPDLFSPSIPPAPQALGSQVAIADQSRERPVPLPPARFNPPNLIQPPQTLSFAAATTRNGEASLNPGPTSLQLGEAALNPPPGLAPELVAPLPPPIVPAEPAARPKHYIREPLR